MVLEIKYVNANNAVIHTENLVTGILAKIRLGTGIWYPPSRPSNVEGNSIFHSRKSPTKMKGI